MVLRNLPVPGSPTICITVGQGPTALAIGAGGGCLDIFTLIYSFSLSLEYGPISRSTIFRLNIYGGCINQVYFRAGEGTKFM